MNKTTILGTPSSYETPQEALERVAEEDFNSNLDPTSFMLRPNGRVVLSADTNDSLNPTKIKELAIKVFNDRKNSFSRFITGTNGRIKNE